MFRVLMAFVLGMSLACSGPERAPAGPNPLSVDEGGRPEVGSLKGEVLEVLPAGSYLYLYLQPEEGEAHWVAIIKKKVEVGEVVEIITLATRSSFHSARLDRDFDSVTFGILP